MVAWWVFAWCIFPRILLSTCLGLYDENTSLVGSMGLGPWCSGEMGFTKSDVLFAVNHFSPTAHKGSFYSGGRDLRFCPFRQPRPLNRGVQTIRCGPWCDSIWSCHLAFCFPFVTFFVLFFLFVPSFGLRIFMIGICFPYKVLIIIVPVFFWGGGFGIYHLHLQFITLRCQSYATSCPIEEHGPFTSPPPSQSLLFLTCFPSACDINVSIHY